MTFLVDECLSPRVARLLRQAGHEAEHVHELGLSSSADFVVLTAAAERGSVVVTADPVFGMLLAAEGSVGPSVILFRGVISRRPEAQAQTILANLEQIAGPLEQGAVAVVGDDRPRLRSLPIAGGDG